MTRVVGAPVESMQNRAVAQVKASNFVYTYTHTHMSITKTSISSGLLLKAYLEVVSSGAFSPKQGNDCQATKAMNGHRNEINIRNCVFFIKIIHTYRWLETIIKDFILAKYARISGNIKNIAFDMVNISS